jgi:hypothetical protein
MRTEALSGPGTRRNEVGDSDRDIQSILSHADISTTQTCHILPNHIEPRLV